MLNSCKDDSPVSGFKEEEGEYVYDYDRYEDGMSAEEFLANYQGIPFKKDQDMVDMIIVKKKELLSVKAVMSLISAT